MSRPPLARRYWPRSTHGENTFTLRDVLSSRLASPVARPANLCTGFLCIWFRQKIREPKSVEHQETRAGRPRAATTRNKDTQSPCTISLAKADTSDQHEYVSSAAPTPWDRRRGFRRPLGCSPLAVHPSQSVADMKNQRHHRCTGAACNRHRTPRLTAQRCVKHTDNGDTVHGPEP